MTALSIRAAAYRAEGDLAKATADLDRVLQLEPRNRSARLARGAIRFDAGNDEAAGADFAAVLEADPKSVDALVGRAAILDRAGEPAAAIADLDRALAIAPRNARAFSNRAHLHMRRHDLPRAAADADRGVALAPADPWSYEVRGLVRRLQGAAPGAIEDFDAMIRLGAADVALRGRLLRAGARMEARDIEGALADYDHVLARKPPLRGASAGRAWARHLAGDHKGAIEDADAALLLDPRSASTLDTRAHAYAAIGDHQKAIADFDRALDIDETLAGARLGRARLYIAAARTAEAIADLERAVGAPQETREARENATEALRLLIELRNGLAAAPAGAAPAASQIAAPSVRDAAGASDSIEPPIWQTQSGRGSCGLAASWPDRAVSIFTKAGLAGPAPGMRFAITLTSDAWRPQAAAEDPPRVVVRFEPDPSKRPDLADRVGVRSTAAGKIEVNLGPLDIAEWRDVLAATRTVRVDAGGVTTVFSAGDLWAWLPAFEQCASLLERPPAR